MKLLLHPGHGKCGSSSIQHWIAGNMDKFRAEGIVVVSGNLEILKQNSRYSPEPFGFLREIVLTKNQTRFETELTDYIKTAGTHAHTVLWTDEFLSDPRVINGPIPIHEILKSKFDKVQLVYFIRRQDDFVMSGWQQWRHKIGLTLEEECRACIKNNNPDYLKNINHFRSIYPETSIKIIPFDRECFLNNDLIQEFCKTLNLQYDKYEKFRDKTNISLNPYICDILSHSPDGIYEGNLDDNAFKNWLERTVESHSLVESHKEFMSPELRDMVMNHFNRENIELHQRFFPEYEFSDLFGKKNIPSERDDIKGIKTAVAIQFEILYKLQKLVNEQNKTISILKSSSINLIFQRLKRFFKGK